MVGTVFPTVLLVMLVALCYLSTSATRRRPIFILNILDLLLGMGTGIWNDYIEVSALSTRQLCADLLEYNANFRTVQINAIIHPFKSFTQATYVSFGIVLSFVPWIAELVLLLRLVVVFPPQLTGRRAFAAIIAFPVIVKLVRLACMICYYVQFARDAPKFGNGVITVQNGPTQSPFVKVEWTLEIFDNG